MLLNCGVGEDSWESPGLQGDPTSPSYRKSVPNIHWKDWCWSWNSNTLATWCKELTSFEKSLMLGKIEGRRRRGWQRMRWLDGVTDLMDMFEQALGVGDAINHLILCCPLLLLPSIFPTIRDFSNESVLRIRWPEYWSFRFSISPSNKYSGLISCRMDWLDLLAVQGTLKSLLQHHTQFKSINSSALNFVYSPTLTSIHDHWKNHSLD